MSNIKVGRYSNPGAVGGWAGWIEPGDRSWIAFIDIDGKPLFFLNRDQDGGVLPNDSSKQ
jgi:hypothetical protein